MFKFILIIFGFNNPSLLPEDPMIFETEQACHSYFDKKYAHRAGPRETIQHTCQPVAVGGGPV